MELRCPQCGAQNREDSLDFPICHQCHEELVKCRQCRHFGLSRDGAAGCQHPSIGRQFTVTANTPPPCGHFTARRHYLARGQPLAQIHRAVWALAAVVIMGMMVVGASILVSRMEPGETESLRLLVEGPGPVQVGQGFCVNCLVHNQSGQTSQPVYLALPAEIAARFDITGISPRPLPILERGGDRYFGFPPIPARGWLDVRLDMSGTRQGEFRLRPRIFAQDGLLKAQADLTLTVVP